MTDDKEQIPLHGLSTRQRKLVEDNLPLVHLTLGRLRRQLRLNLPGRETRELFQEGCLALIEAVRSHDPSRHGAFPCFAIARIHFAVSSYARENSHLIRVPFITQRRRRLLGKGGSSERHNPDRLPLVIPFNEKSCLPRHGKIGPAEMEHSSARLDAPTIGELIRERYDAALIRVVTEMKLGQPPTKEKQEARLLDRCAEERWTVPEPEEQTSIREMARGVGCSPTKIARRESCFRKRLAEVMSKDATYAALRELARRSRSGMRHRLTREEADAIEDRSSAIPRPTPSHRDSESNGISDSRRRIPR